MLESITFKPTNRDGYYFVDPHQPQHHQHGYNQQQQQQFLDDSNSFIDANGQRSQIFQEERFGFRVKVTIVANQVRFTKRLQGQMLTLYTRTYWP